MSILINKSFDKEEFYDYIIEGLYGQFPVKGHAIEYRRGKSDFEYNGKRYKLASHEATITMVNRIGSQYDQPTMRWTLECLDGESEFEGVPSADTKTQLVDFINGSLKQKAIEANRGELPEVYTYDQFEEEYEKVDAEQKVKILEAAMDRMATARCSKWEAITKACGYTTTPSGKLVSDEYLQRNRPKLIIK